MKKLSMGVCLLLGVFLLAGSAWATPILSLSDGVNTIQIEDGLAGDSNPLAGAVTFIGSVGSFDTNVTTGLTKPLIGSSTHPVMDLNSIDVLTTGAGALTITWTDTDFTGIPSGYGGFETLLGGTTDGTVELWTYVDETNSGAEGTLVSYFGPLDGAFRGSDFVGIDGLSAPFSITMVAKINFSDPGPQITSFDAKTTVPEPATMLLLGVGICGLVFMGRRKLIRHG
jgi:hypothetical protein